MKEFHTKLKSNNFQDSKHELCETDRQKNGWVRDEQITRITKRITVNSFLMDTSLKQTPRVGLYLSLHLLVDSIMQTSLSKKDT